MQFDLIHSHYVQFRHIYLEVEKCKEQNDKQEKP